MSVFREKDRRAYRYEFQYKKRTYKGTTGQLTREAAEAVERREQDRVRRVAAGLTDLRDAPPFAVWAGVYYDYKAHSDHKVKRPDQIDFLLRTVLKFWGRRPSDPAKVDAAAPYHDRTLADPILDPAWLDRFEEWMRAEGFSGSHRNHLRSQLSGMYRVAMIPKFRAVTGVTTNPMEGVPRDRRVARVVSLTPEQVTAWIAHASYHVRLAIAIAALAPKLRVGNVLALEWNRHVDRALTVLTVTDHKTDARTGQPLVVMVSEQLRAILLDARRRARSSRWVVTYRGRRVRSIRDGVRGAAERAGLPYGRATAAGVTFHTLRHAVATWLAEMENLTEPMRAALLAHSDIATTQRYTHLRPVKERGPLEQLSARLPIAALVTQPWSRWSQAREREEFRENPDLPATGMLRKQAASRGSLRPSGRR